MNYKNFPILIFALCTSSSIFADSKATPAAAKKETVSMDFSRTRSSEKKLFSVKYSPSVEPIPAEKAHDWNFEIKDANGKAINQAEITSVGGFMPEHDHGFGDKPVIKRPSGPGIVRVTNLKFVMGGVWVLTVKIREGKNEDTVVFNVKI